MLACRGKCRRFESESIHAARTNLYTRRHQEYSLARPMVDSAAIRIRFVAHATHRLPLAEVVSARDGDDGDSAAHSRQLRQIDRDGLG